MTWLLEWVAGPRWACVALWLIGVATGLVWRAIYDLHR